MQEWANYMLNEQLDDIVDSASSIYSENFEFKIDGFDKKSSNGDVQPSVMSAIENFEKLQNTSCNQNFDDLNTGFINFDEINKP